MSKEEKMIDVKCSVCMKDMQMSESFLKAGKERGIDAMHMPHICSDCTDKMGDVLGDKKRKGFVRVKKFMETYFTSNATNEIASPHSLSEISFDSLVND